MSSIEVNYCFQTLSNPTFVYMNVRPLCYWTESLLSFDNKVYAQFDLIDCVFFIYLTFSDKCLGFPFR